MFFLAAFPRYLFVPLAEGSCLRVACLLFLFENHHPNDGSLPSPQEVESHRRPEAEQERGWFARFITGSNLHFKKLQRAYSGCCNTVLTDVFSSQQPF